MARLGLALLHRPAFPGQQLKAFVEDVDVPSSAGDDTEYDFEERSQQV